MRFSEFNEAQKHGDYARGSDPMPKAKPGRKRHPLKDKLVGETEDNTTGLTQGPPFENTGMVAAVQEKLEELGYSVGSTGVDGKYGPRTARAVAAFKQDFDLSGDGTSLSTQDLDAMRGASPVDDPTPTGNERSYGRQGRRGSGAVDLPDPEGGGSGSLRLNRSMGPLLDLDGSQSRMTQRDADSEMQETIRMARRMAEIFGQSVTINDAIAKAGTSRERNTPGSQHFHGTALDLDISGFSDEEKLQLVNAALQAGFTGFGFGNNILHVDRGPRRHWDYGNSTFGGLRVASLGNAVRSGASVA